MFWGALSLRLAGSLLLRCSRVSLVSPLMTLGVLTPTLKPSFILNYFLIPETATLAFRTSTYNRGLGEEWGGHNLIHSNDKMPFIP